MTGTPVYSQASMTRFRHRPALALAGLMLALYLSGLLAWPGVGVGAWADAQGVAAPDTGPDAASGAALDARVLQPAASVRFSLGVAGQPVAEAWNPLRLELRDAPPATLTMHIDQGTLRSGEVPLTITLEVRGGAGVSIFEELVYVPRFATLGWRLATPERVLASGSIAGREADERPLDLVLTSNPGAFRLPYLDAFGPGTRLVDVTAALLPQEPAAYAGVRSLVIDGTSAAPRLEAVAAAVTGGAVVVLAGPLPPSHNELLLLLNGADATRLGSGALLYVEGGRVQAVEAVRQVEVPAREALQAALLQEQLVEPPTPIKDHMVVLMVAVYALGVLLLLRFAGAPGLSAALAIAGLLSLVAWQLLRPAEPQLEGRAALALAGGELAAVMPVHEVLTMPHTTITLSERVRPLMPQAYWIDAAGTHIALDRWRSVLLEVAPRLGQAQLTVQEGAPYNHGPGPLRNLYLVGEGLQGDLANDSGTLRPSEGGSADWAAPLAPLLPAGTWLAQDDCLAGCTTWVVYPEVQLVASAGAPALTEQPATDPFRNAPAGSGNGP